MTLAEVLVTARGFPCGWSSTPGRRGVHRGDGLLRLPPAQIPPPPHAGTAVELLPDRTGELGFACGMNMVHGKLVVEPAEGGDGERDQPRPGDSLLTGPAEGHTHEAESVLGAVPGVREVETDVASERLTVAYGPGRASVDDLRAAVASSGLPGGGTSAGTGGGGGQGRGSRRPPPGDPRRVDVGSVKERYGLDLEILFSFAA